MSAKPMRYLFRPEELEAERDRAVRCGACRRALDKDQERQVAWCGRYRFMTGTTTPALCEGFER